MGYCSALFCRTLAAQRHPRKRQRRSGGCIKALTNQASFIISITSCLIPKLLWLRVKAGVCCLLRARSMLQNALRLASKMLSPVLARSFPRRKSSGFLSRLCGWISTPLPFFMTAMQLAALEQRRPKSGCKRAALWLILSIGMQPFLHPPAARFLSHRRSMTLAISRLCS